MTPVEEQIRSSQLIAGIQQKSIFQSRWYPDTPLYLALFSITFFLIISSLSSIQQSHQIMSSLSIGAASLLAFSTLMGSSAAVSNGHVRVPMMGYNTYNDVVCSPNTTWTQNTINALKDRGFLAAGYNYFQIDCGWQGYNRSPNGSITYDSANFPTGIQPLSDLARSKGFKWSMYTDQGVYACDTSSRHRPGSLNYEEKDAAMFAQWNTDYVKVDNCWVDGNSNAPKDPRSDFPDRYTKMWNALTKYGINEMLVCQWGTPYQASDGLQGPAQWTAPLSTSFRVSDDIAQGWYNVIRIMNEAIHVNLNPTKQGPGHISDMDLLEVGNSGMTLDEQKSHFALWALFKSSLFISTNVPQMSADAVAILQNKNLIAINQDSLMDPAKLSQRFTNDNDQFKGNMSNGDLVFLLLDQTNKARNLYVEFKDHGISTADVLDAWTGATQTGVDRYETSVGAHGSLVIRLSNIKYISPALAAPSVTYYEVEKGSLIGGAKVQSCSGCSGGQNVGYIQSGSSVTLSGIRTSQTYSDVLFDYINAEVGYLGGSANFRSASVSVNGGSPVEVQFPLTGYNWTKDLLKCFKVRLFGFNTDSNNTITISGSSTTQYAPDFDRIAVVN